MSYEIHLNIPEDSQRGHLIASFTAEQHITPSQAVEKIIDIVAQRNANVPTLAQAAEAPSLAHESRAIGQVAHKKLWPADRDW